MGVAAIACPWLSISDSVCLFCSAAGLGEDVVAVIDRFPALAALKERVANIPNIAKYLAKRA